MNQRKVSPAGFSLIEVAMVIVVGGIVLAACESMLLSYLRGLAVTTTQSRMQDIDNALAHYVNVNGVLPCVAALTDTQDSVSFGRQITDPLGYPPGSSIPVTSPPTPNTSTDCYLAYESPNLPAKAVFATTGTTPGVAPDTRTQTTNANGYIVMGAVPVRELGLPDQDIADAWGDRFVYAVTYALTVASGYDPTQGSINVVDGSTPPNNVVKPAGSAQYVIVSYGANRTGSYTISGGSSGGPGNPPSCPSGLGSQNCTYPTNTFVQTTVTDQSAASTFDNYVLFHGESGTNSSSFVNTLPSGFISPFVNTAVCPAGWITYVGAACTASAGSIICCQKF